MLNLSLILVSYQRILIGLSRVRTQTPPAALILFSAVLVKSLALTTHGIFGRFPLPSTLKYPDLVTSMTGALSLLLAAFFLVSSLTRDHNLSVLIVGQCFQFL